MLSRETDPTLSELCPEVRTKASIEKPLTGQI